MQEVSMETTLASSLQRVLWPLPQLESHLLLNPLIKSSWGF